MPEMKANLLILAAVVFIPLCTVTLGQTTVRIYYGDRRVADDIWEQAGKQPLPLTCERPGPLRDLWERKNTYHLRMLINSTRTEQKNESFFRWEDGKIKTFRSKILSSYHCEPVEPDFKKFRCTVNLTDIRRDLNGLLVCHVEVGKSGHFKEIFLRTYQVEDPSYLLVTASSESEIQLECKATNVYPKPELMVLSVKDQSNKWEKLTVENMTTETQDKFPNISVSVNASSDALGDEYFNISFKLNMSAEKYSKEAKLGFLCEVIFNNTHPKARWTINATFDMSELRKYGGKDEKTGGTTVGQDNDKGEGKGGTTAADQHGKDEKERKEKEDRDEKKDKSDPSTGGDSATSNFQIVTKLLPLILPLYLVRI